MILETMTSPDMVALSRDVTVLLPVGSLEQHGQHLPVFTDTLLVDAFARRAEATRPDSLLLLPTQWMGASAHHLFYPGTLTAALQTHIGLLIETVEGLIRHGFRRFFILNGHSGNIDTLRIACRELKIRHPSGTFAGAAYWDLAGTEIATALNGPRKEIGHSCEVETSLMLALHPHLVRHERIRNDPWEMPSALRGASLAFNFEEVTETGQIGYAAHASAETGHRLLEIIHGRILEALDAVEEVGSEK